MTGTYRIDQQMAGAAAAMLPPAVTKDLRTRYRQLPVLLRTAGLAATYAFLVAKSGGGDALARAYGQVADGLREHFTERRGLVDLTGAETNLRLLDALADLPTPVYLRASAEAEALAGWLSRLADARFRESVAAGDRPDDADPGDRS